MGISFLLPANCCIYLVVASYKQYILHIFPYTGNKSSCKSCAGSRFSGFSCFSLLWKRFFSFGLCCVSCCTLSGVTHNITSRRVCSRVLRYKPYIQIFRFEPVVCTMCSFKVLGCLLHVLYAIRFFEFFVCVIILYVFIALSCLN